MTNPMGTNLTISAIAIAQLTATLTGGGFKRSATKADAIKRFIAVAAEKGIGEGTAAMILAASDPKQSLEQALTPVIAPADGKGGAGLARLRKAQNAEAIRAATNADAEGALAAVRASMPAVDHSASNRIIANYVASGGPEEVAAEIAARRASRKAAVELAEANAPAIAAKPAKVKAAKPEGAAPRKRLDPSAVIAAVVENPKKVGSRSHARFALYRAGTTVQVFIDACVAAGFPASEANADISWDRRKGNITIADPAAA